MTKQLKTLHLIDIPWNSALTRYAVDQAKALRKAGHTVYFGAVKKTLCHETLEKEGFQILDIPSRKKYFILPAMLRLRKFIKEKNIGVINAHTGKTQTIAILLSYSLKNSPALIRTKADAKYPKKSFLSDKLSRIITGSGIIKKMYTEKEKTETIYQPAPTFNMPLPLFKKNLRIGILARLDPVKGHKHFLKAASLLLQERKDLKFVIGGYEANIKYLELKKLAEELKISEHMEYSGTVKRTEAFISSCDIGIIASTKSEVVSRVLLEWMSAGRPVISTNVGCVPEILNSQYTVPPENPDLMAEKIKHLINSPRLFEEASLQNKNLAQKKYNLENFERETERIFLEAEKTK